MKTYPEIESIYNTIITSDVFRLNGPAIDLPAALLELGQAVVNTDLSEDEFIFDRIGEYTEACLGDLIIGAYWALTEWHAGQSSPEYAAMCALGRVFKPGCTGIPDEEDSARTAYDLVNQWFEERHTPTSDPTVTIDGWTRQTFAAYLTETLIPDLRGAGMDATADDFETALRFMENPNA